MNAPDRIELPLPDDFHVHLRQMPSLVDYARRLAESVGRALIMPNTVPPIASPDAIARYRREIQEAAPGLTPLLTWKLLPSVDPDLVAALGEAGAIAGKLYPAGVTTNAEDGFSRVSDAAPLFEAMEAEGMVLCIHAESPDAGVFERERVFLPEIETIVARHPGLRVVVEHVSDAATVEFVRSMPETVAATVTPHHLIYSVEELLGNGIRPHLYCKPMLKSISDREAIQRVVLSGDPKFFFGSDSAPHPVSAKESACGAAGVYCAPTAIPLLIEFFSREIGVRDNFAEAAARLGDFVGRFGADFYRLERPVERVIYRREPWRVPQTVDGVVPLAAGETLYWKREGSEVAEPR